MNNFEDKYEKWTDIFYYQNDDINEEQECEVTSSVLWKYDRLFRQWNDKQKKYIKNIYKIRKKHLEEIHQKQIEELKSMQDENLNELDTVLQKLR